jgi:4-hydroxy-tetrahydrodipicolinate synthase
MPQMIKGTGVALITPFRQNGSIDDKALENLVKHVTAGGVDFLVVLGTTAESPTLTAEEKQEVIHAVIHANSRKLPIVCGVGGNNTAEVVHALRTMDLKGIHAILSVAPYYNKPSQAGLYAHFKEVAAATKLPVVLYNVPGRTGSNILPETVCRLAKDCKNIVAIKEASGNMVQFMELMRTKPSTLHVLSGDDNLILPQMVIGMEGIISVAANAYPKEMTELVNLSIVGKYDKARKLMYKLLPAIDLMFVEGNPSGIKCFLKFQRICENVLRLPLVPVSAATEARIKEAVTEMGH